MQKHEALLAKFKKLIEMGNVLSISRDFDDTLDKVLTYAIEISNSEGGSLYQQKNNDLYFYHFINNRLKIDKKFSTSNGDTVVPIPLYDDAGEPDMQHTVTSAIHLKKTIRIDDAYADEKYDLSGIHKFDAENNYKTSAILTVPMQNHRAESIGALQLINPLNESGLVGQFSDETQQMIESLAVIVKSIINQRCFLA